MNKRKYSVLFIPFSVLIYSIFFEPTQLELTSHEITIGNSDKSIVLAHLTDLHTSGLGTIEQKMIDAVNKVKPDVIIITGDVATPNGTTKGYEEVLSKLKAPLGVFFVQGNWEYWEPIKELKEIFKRTGIVNLTNNSHHIKDALWLVGLDDEYVGSPRTSIYKSVPDNQKIISMFHSPALFKAIKDKTDLAFAGHSHGGQIRIPFVGPIWTPTGTDKYVAGWFEDGNSKMYVSRGIGNSILPIRFNCRPEIAFIKVHY